MVLYLAKRAYYRPTWLYFLLDKLDSVTLYSLHTVL